MLSRQIKQTQLRCVYRAFAHHEAKYDWRDDPKYNPDLIQNPRIRGWNPYGNQTPYQGHAIRRNPVVKHDLYDIRVVARPEFQPVQKMPTLPVFFVANKPRLHTKIFPMILLTRWITCLKI